jgi:hypothetical protein
MKFEERGMKKKKKDHRNSHVSVNTLGRANWQGNGVSAAPLEKVFRISDYNGADKYTTVSENKRQFGSFW